MAEPPDARSWGIEPGYHDVGGTWHATPNATRDALLAALGATQPEPPGAPVWVVRAGSGDDTGGAGVIVGDHGDEYTIDRYIPRDIEPGYYTLHHADDRVTRLIVGPGQCPMPPAQSWGLGVQLPTLWSARSCGIGDLDDLRVLGEWAARAGASFTLVSPLGAPRLVAPLQASPYSPSSRRWRNPLHLRVEGLVSADEAALVDRDAVWAIKEPELRAAFDAFIAGGGDHEFDAWLRDDDVTHFALHTALDEAGVPRPFPHPASSQAAQLLVTHAPRVRFHVWLQLQLARQLAAAAAAMPVVTDLPVGFDAEGADAWVFQDAVLPGGWRIGAPPDEFNPAGQDWGLPPLDPWRLRATGYEPFIRTVRAALTSAAGLRVDHVMGLFRLYVLPPDGGATDGTYLRYPWWDLLEILCLEAWRAGAWVVGEDLGTVEPWVRAELAARRILSTKVLWFEDNHPTEWPDNAFAAITTHDLPTAAGLWTGADAGDQRAAGVTPDEDGWGAVRDRVAGWAGIDTGARTGEFVAACHELLARSPAVAVVATVEDALQLERRPNLPGTISEQRPNWSIRLPVSIDAFDGDARVDAVVDVLSKVRSPT